MSSSLTSVDIQPIDSHIYSVIWLHGLGADGHDFESIVPSLQLEYQNHVHFIFPNAPIQPVTINSKMKMRAWYDIFSVSMENHTVDMDGIYRSAELISQVIQAEISQGIPAKNIILAGFSQGGVLALHVGLRFPQKLAGVIALSAYLPTLAALETEGTHAGKITPVLMAHGILDPIVAIEAGKTVFDHLSNTGYNIEWHDYLMEHSVCPEEISQLSAFMNSVLR